MRLYAMVLAADFSESNKTECISNLVILGQEQGLVQILVDLIDNECNQKRNRACHP